MSLLKYEQIAESLRVRISEGEFGPGAVLPSGRDLCEQWNVSRATAIKAMDVLRNDGLVVGRQGSGFVVSDVPLARPAGGRSAGCSRITGGSAFRRIGTPSLEVPPRRIASALELAHGAKALRRARLMLLDDGTPHSMATAWFPAEVAAECPRLADDEPIAEGTTHYVGRCTGRRPERGADVTTVRLATAEEIEALAVPQPAAVAVVLHVAHDGLGPLVCEEGVTPSEHWELTDSYSMSTGS